VNSQTCGSPKSEDRIRRRTDGLLSLWERMLARAGREDEGRLLVRVMRKDAAMALEGIRGRPRARNPEAGDVFRDA
jgi:hypothetical protein